MSGFGQVFVIYHLGMDRLRLILIVLILLLIPAGSVYAAPLTQGAYEAEDCALPNCTTTGSWSVVSDAARKYYSTSTNTASLSFQAIGKVLILHRSVGVGTGTTTVCVNASCTAVVNSSSVGDLSYPVIFSLTGGTDNVTITSTSASPVYLDYWIILDTPGVGAFPTPVPTATILPSSTPASTTTPQPTPTPQPTATPMSMVWAISPNTKYDMANGQMVAFDFTITVGDLVLGIFLFGLLLMLIFKLFLDETRKRR